MIKRFDKNKL